MSEGSLSKESVSLSSRGHSCLSHWNPVGTLLGDVHQECCCLSWSKPCSKPTSVQLHGVEYPLPQFSSVGEEWVLEDLCQAVDGNLDRHSAQCLQHPISSNNVELLLLFTFLIEVGIILNSYMTFWLSFFPSIPLFIWMFLFQSLSPSLFSAHFKVLVVLKFPFIPLSFYFTQLLETELIHSHDINYD